MSHVLEPGEIFVFGSNEAGIHGAGAAKAAFLNYGAIIGRGVGLQGDSYAIPTKDRKLKPLPIATIKQYVNQFLEYAKLCPEVKFFVTRVGCGFAGYSEFDIAPLFWGAPANCRLPEGWRATVL